LPLPRHRPEPGWLAIRSPLQGQPPVAVPSGQGSLSGRTFSPACFFLVAQASRLHSCLLVEAVDQVDAMDVVDSESRR